MSSRNQEVLSNKILGGTIITISSSSCDDRMADHEFIELESEPKQWWFGEKVSSMEMCAPLSVLPDITVEQTIEIMNSEGYDQLPVIDNAG